MSLARSYETASSVEVLIGSLVFLAVYEQSTVIEHVLSGNSHMRVILAANHSGEPVIVN